MRKTYYFTYGTCGQAFFGGWTEVIAENFNLAIGVFTLFHPRNNGVVACASIYDEEEFKKTNMYASGNYGYRCHERIELNRMIMKGTQKQ